MTECVGDGNSERVAVAAAPPPTPVEAHKTFYDSNLTVLRSLNGADRHVTSLGDVAIGDKLVTGDGITTATVTSVERKVLPTTRFVARTTRPRRNVFEAMCDGIGVATGGRLLCASPMPDRYELSELSLGPLKIKGGLTLKVADGTGTCQVFSKRYSIVAGIQETRWLDRTTVAADAVQSAIRRQGLQGYTVTQERAHRTPQVKVSYGQQEIVVPSGPGRGQTINRAEVIHRRADGSEIPLRSMDDVIRAVADDSANVHKAYSFRNVADVVSELDAAAGWEQRTRDAARDEPRKFYTEFCGENTLRFTSAGTRTTFAFPIHPYVANANAQAPNIDEDVAWALGYFFGDGFKNTSRFVLSMESDHAPSVEDTPAYVKEEMYVVDASDGEHAPILRHLRLAALRLDAHIELEDDPRARQAGKALIVKMVRDDGARTSVMRRAIEICGLSAQCFAEKHFTASDMEIVLAWPANIALAMLAGFIDADGTGPVASLQLLGTTIGQSTTGGHEALQVIMAMLAGRHGFDVRTVLERGELRQAPLHDPDQQERIVLNEAYRAMSREEKVRFVRRNFGIRCSERLVIRLLGPATSLPLALTKKRDVDREMTQGIGVFAFDHFDEGLRECTFLTLDGNARTIATANGFVLGVGDDYSPIAPGA